eukprot:8447879-Prorocentrum_lima.AAC.1
MTSSLVGSEMCIRDRLEAVHNFALHISTGNGKSVHNKAAQLPLFRESVSYTHLTLPTICSV